MKKIIAIIAITAGISLAGEYAVTKTITATAFKVERLTVDLNRTEPVFIISGRYVDADGKTVESKMIRCSLAQARQIMPEIDQILAQSQAAIQTNLGNLLGE